MDALRVLLVQLAPEPHDVAANLDVALRLIADHPDADLVVLPELWLQGYTLPGIDAIALDPDDEPVHRLRAAAAAHGTAVVVGLAERLEGAPPANAVLCIDRDGALAGAYRKVNLFGPEEVEHFTRGDRYTVVRLCGLRMGLLICFDLEFPEPARALAVAGAEVLVTVSANMTPYQREHELFARSRAAENRRPLVYVNRVGVESGLTFVGRSCIVDAGGEVVADLGDAARVELVAVPLGAPPPPDYLGERRPDVPAVPWEAQRPPSRARAGGEP